MSDRVAALVEVLGGDVTVVAVALRAAARQARRDARPLGARLACLIAEFEAAEHAWKRRPATPSGTTLDADGSAPPRSERSLGVADVAHLVGVSERAVRKAAATGRLVGRLGADGRWWFYPDDVTKWQANRRRSSA
jgi:hypothetical protein